MSRFDDSAVFQQLEHLLDQDPKVQQLLSSLEQDQSALLGLMAELQLRMGREGEDPTSGLLEPYLRGVTARNAPKGFGGLAMLARIIVKRDGVQEYIPIVVYDADLRKSGFNAATTRFMLAHKDFTIADESFSAIRMIDANLKYSSLAQASSSACQSIIDGIVKQASGSRMSGNDVTSYAEQIMSQCLVRVKKYHVAAYLLLRQFQFVALPVGVQYTMSVGPSDEAASGAGVDSSADFDDLLSVLESRSPYKKALSEAVVGGKAKANISLRFSPTFVVNQVIDGGIDVALQRRIAKIACQKFNIPDVYYQSLFDFSSMLDGITAVLIHEAMHTLRGHNLPSSFAYDKTDKVFGDVFQGIVNTVGDAMINQNIVRTTEIPVMLKGGIIKSWSFDVRVSPEKLYKELVEKPFDTQKSNRNREIEKMITRLYQDCKRDGVKDLSGSITFSWPSSEGKDVQFFTLTRLAIRGLASSAKAEVKSRFELLKEVLEEGIRRAKDALDHQAKYGTGPSPERPSLDPEATRDEINDILASGDLSPEELQRELSKRLGGGDFYGA